MHIDDQLDKLVTNEIRKKLDWTKLEDFTLHVELKSFVMLQSAFYFTMFERLTNRFIDTGIMNHLANKILKEKIKIDDLEDSKKILSLDDLSFGFNIWIGFCCICIISFIFEHLCSKLYIKWMKFHFIKRKISFAKIWSLKGVKDSKVVTLKSQTIKHFRIVKKLGTSDDDSKEENENIKIMHEEEVFGEFIHKLQIF